MENNSRNIIDIPGINPEAGITNAGSKEVLIELFGDVYKIIDDRCNLIEKYLSEKDIKNYTTQVHALKTTCRMMGATELGENFFTLEKLGKEENLEQIEKFTPDVLNAFRSLKPYLEQYVPEKTEVVDFSKEDAVSSLNDLISAIDDFDLSACEEITKKLSACKFEEPIASKIAQLEKLVSDLDYSEAKELIESILQEL